MGKLKLQECKICREVTNRLGSHILIHNIEVKDYYDKYIKLSSDGNCKNKECNKETNFHGLHRGYSNACSTSCSSKLYHKDRVYSDDYLKGASDRLKSQHKCPEFKKNNSLRSSIRLSNKHKEVEFSVSHKLRSSIRLKKLHENEEFMVLKSSSLIKSRPERSKSLILTKAINSRIEEGIFYIMRLSDSIKIGLCYFDKNLKYLKERVRKLNPTEYEIFIGSIKDVAEFELLIKESYVPLKQTEYFSLDLYDEIKIKIPNTILPYSTQVV